MELAPIALFTYNRLRHTQETIAALQKNNLAAESGLFIFSDGPKSAADEPKVGEVREYLGSLTGFRNVTVIERKRNLGLAQSIITGVAEIVNKYGRIIVLEDDMVTSPYFLKFMNDALELYRDEERVISIHGYIYPIKTQLPETFFIIDTGCWGWATWKRGWALFEPDGKKLIQAIEERNLSKKFDINGSYGFTKMLRDQTKGRNNSWAIRWQASAFLKDKLTLFPGSSLVRNIGHDTSGAHCAETNCFDVELSISPVTINRIPIEENQAALKELEKYFRSIKPNLFKSVIKKLKKIIIK